MINLKERLKEEGHIRGFTGKSLRDYEVFKRVVDEIKNKSVRFIQGSGSGIVGVWQVFKK